VSGDVDRFCLPEGLLRNRRYESLVVMSILRSERNPLASLRA
jgi:hypothetical protein